MGTTNARGRRMLPVWATAPERPWPDAIPGYWRHATRCHNAWPKRNSDFTNFWVWEAVESIWVGGIPEAIDRLVQLADAAPEPELLAYFGTGPIEDLVQFGGGEYEDEIISAARRSPNFAVALRAVYPTPNALLLWDRLGIKRGTA